MDELILLLLIFIVVGQANQIVLNKKLLMIFKSIDANPSSYLSARIILMIKDGEDLKAVKQIKKQTGFNLEESKNILMKVKWDLAKTSD